MKKKLTEIQAHNLLYELWQYGYVNSNFTEDHSEYDEVLLDVMEKGYMDEDEWYWLLK